MILFALSLIAASAATLAGCVAWWLWRVRAEDAALREANRDLRERLERAAGDRDREAERAATAERANQDLRDHIEEKRLGVDEAIEREVARRTEERVHAATWAYFHANYEGDFTEHMKQDAKRREDRRKDLAIIARGLSPRFGNGAQ